MTTETIALYTTVCPVSDATKTPAPTATTEASLPWTTSTVYTTRVYTITSCAPEVTNCPVNHVTTETIPWYTTVCPVTATATSTPAGPAGPGGASFPEITAIGQPSAGAPVVEAANPTSAVGSSSLQTLVKPATSVGAPQGSSGESSAVYSSPSQPTQPAGAGSPYPSGSAGNAAPSGSWSGVPTGPSTIPSIPGANGASVMSAGLVGLAIVLAAQVLVM